MNRALNAIPDLPAALNSLLHSPFALNLGWALLHFVWQGAFIAGLTALLLTLLRNARPQTRYAVACAGLLLCLALPMARLLSFDGISAAPGVANVAAIAGDGIHGVVPGAVSLQ